MNKRRKKERKKKRKKRKKERTIEGQDRNDRNIYRRKNKQSQRKK